MKINHFSFQSVANLHIIMALSIAVCQADLGGNITGFIKDPVGTTQKEIKRIPGNVQNAGDALLRPVCSKVFQAYTSSVAGACLFEKNSPGFRNVRVENFLIQQGFFSPSDFSGVSFMFCDIIKHGASGIVPLPNLVLIQLGYRDAALDVMAPLIAHEMVHIKQIRSWGWDDFACYYSEQISRRGSAAFLEKNKIEGQAYEIENLVKERLSLLQQPQQPRQSIPSPVQPPSQQVQPTLKFTDSCVIYNEPFLINSSGEMLSIPKGYARSGQKVSPLNSYCWFDLLDNRSTRYCVNRNGQVLLGTSQVIGVCRPCTVNGCN